MTPQILTLGQFQLYDKSCRARAHPQTERKPVTGTDDYKYHGLVNQALDGRLHLSRQANRYEVNRRVAYYEGIAFPVAYQCVSVAWGTEHRPRHIVLRGGFRKGTGLPR